MATAIQENPPQGVQLVPLAEIHTSKTNPRKHFPKEELDDLAGSIKAHGLLQPILLRPHGKGYEIVAGERRFRASLMAALETIPALVRTLSDTEVLEIQVVENLQRRDLHPLEEAEGYQQLMGKPGYDVARVAERVGRSIKYVYDRVKLLTLGQEAQKLFFEGKIMAGHAILLARLKPEDQKRVIGSSTQSYINGGLFEHEHGLFDSAESWKFKPVGVRELQAWIDEHVRFEAAAPDPMLFPETAEVLTSAREEDEKIVPITHDYHVRPEAKEEGARTYGPQSWKRADGKSKSKTCDSAVTGVIVVGAHRGEAFKVCTDKKGCKVHWAQEQREAKKRAGSSSRSGEKDAYARQQERYRKEQEQQAAARKRWEKAAPAILETLAGAIKKASTSAGGLLAQTVLDAIGDRRDIETGARFLSRGKTAEDLVRFAAFLALAREAGEWNAEREFPKTAKAFGLDVKKIVDQEAPDVPEPRCRECGCTEKKACDVGGHGCSWVKKPDPKTGLGLCSAPACAAKAKAPKKRRR